MSEIPKVNHPLHAELAVFEDADGKQFVAVPFDAFMEMQEIIQDLYVHQQLTEMEKEID